MTRSLTLEAIYGPHASWEGAKLENLRWSGDSSAFVYLDQASDGLGKSIYRQGVKDDAPAVLVAGDALYFAGKRVLIHGFEMSSDGRFFLLEASSQLPRFRYAAPPPDREHYVYDLDEEALRPLSGIVGGQRYAKLAPQGRRVAFIRSGNLFMVDGYAGWEVQLTQDGGECIYNGENRGYGQDGWCWSPDGRKILFVRTDETAVESIPLVDYLPAYPRVHWLKYPKAGAANWRFHIGVIDVETAQIMYLPLGGDEDVYFPRLHWSKDAQVVAIQRLNRLQNRLDLLAADLESGEVRVLITETDPCWVRADDDLVILKDRDGFIWTSERSGYKHAYLYSGQGELLNQITQGPWEVSGARATSSLLGVDEEDDWLYFLGKRESPIEEHVYRIKLAGTQLEKLSQSPGWHAVSLSPDRRYFIHTYSDINTPPQVELSRSHGETVRQLKDGHLPELAEFAWARPEFMTVQIADGVSLNAVMTKPVDFDPQRKYPVVFYGYGGVSSQTVVNRWGGARALFHQLMTQKGYIIFTVDNRGTGGRGKEFEAYMYKSIGTTPVLDHIEAARYLKQLPYVDDSAGFGIYGGSGGGFLTCLALMRGAEYFGTGVALASATNYRLYQSCWSERYLGMPEECPEVYLRESVVPYVDLLKGHLMLVHGMADDNVQLQHSIEVAEALQGEGKQFDMMYYHGREHSIRGENTELHLYQMISDYFLQHMPPASKSIDGKEHR